jgi:hypothetical protein
MGFHTDETFIIIPGAIALHSQLTHADRIIYGAMLALSSRTGYCCATHDRIASRSDTSRETVARAIAKLSGLRCLRDCTGDPDAAAELRKAGIEPHTRSHVYQCLFRTHRRKPKLLSMPKQRAV